MEMEWKYQVMRKGSYHCLQGEVKAAKNWCCEQARVDSWQTMHSPREETSGGSGAR